ncbi:MAG: COG1361 S-layer family protein [Candidatus Aenigmarchaeota archaeon]|nr:COG1361 S-layer family protein [Candidatus Aenigmarchaeota archaeon]
MAVFLAGAVCPAFAYEPDFPAISMTVLRYEPFPAQPGSYVKLWIRIENFGMKPAENFMVVLDPEYPFYLDPSENDTRHIRYLEGFENILIDYKLRVAPDAVQGDNELKIRYSTGDRDIWVQKTLKVNVQTLDKNIDIVSVSSRNVAPGGTVPLEVMLLNNGDASLRDISLKLDLSSLPFYPINSTSEKKIYLMEKGKSTSVSFELMASPTADCQPYKVPVTLSYKSLDGTQYSRSDYLTIVVCSMPDLVMGLESSEILYSGTSGTVTVNIVNKGLSDVKLLTLELLGGDYEIISPASVYVGNLESDDFDTVDYDLYINESGEIPLQFLAAYRDANNGEHKAEFTVPLKIYTKEELSRYQLVPAQDNTGLFILLLLAAVVAYWYYRRKKKKK